MLELFSKWGIIDNETIEIYRYGYNLLVKKIIHIILILSIGIICGESISMVIFLITYATVRAYAGGYHANTERKCLLCTIIVSFAAAALIKGFQLVSYMYILGTLLICTIVIWTAAPREAINRPLSTQERNLYRKKVRVYLVLFSSVSILLGIWYRVVPRGVLCALLIQTCMLFIPQAQD